MASHLTYDRFTGGFHRPQESIGKVLRGEIERRKLRKTMTKQKSKPTFVCDLAPNEMAHTSDMHAM